MYVTFIGTQWETKSDQYLYKHTVPTAWQVSTSDYYQITYHENAVLCVNCDLDWTALTVLHRILLMLLVHTYIHAYIHTYIQTHTHKHTYIHTHIHTYTHIHTNIHTHTYIHTYINNTYIHTYVHIPVYIHTHTYIHTYIHTHIRTYIHIHTYIHTYIRTYTCIHTHTHTYIHIYHVCIKKRQSIAVMLCEGVFLVSLSNQFYTDKWKDLYICNLNCMYNRLFKTISLQRLTL